MAFRYNQAPTDACPLYGLPDSCTYIASQCDVHNIQSIGKQHASCQLTHAAIKTVLKSVGNL